MENISQLKAYEGKQRETINRILFQDLEEPSEKLLKEYNSKELIKIFTDYHYASSVLKMPESSYHSIDHAINVSNISTMLAQYDENSEYNYSNDGGKYSRVSKKDWEQTHTIFNLSVAGLFHDSLHTQNGDIPDYVNLAKAIKVFNDHYYSHSSLGKDLQTLPINPERVNELIISTLSDGEPKERFDEHAKILYDADTLEGIRHYIINNVPTYHDALRGEGFLAGMAPIDFIEYRGLFSQNGKKWWNNNKQRIIDSSTKS